MVYLRMINLMVNVSFIHLIILLFKEYGNIIKLLKLLNKPNLHELNELL